MAGSTGVAGLSRHAHLEEFTEVLQTNTGWLSAADRQALARGNLGIDGDTVASGTQGSTVGDVDVTYSSNDPSITPDGAVTFADGSTPTVDELLEAFVELNAKVQAMSDLLDDFGISA